MTWGNKDEVPFDISVGEVKRAIPRMQKLGTKFVRIMSFKPKDDDAQTPPVVFERIREVTKMFLDAGIQPVHENCMNYGGMSSDHALEVLEKCPGLKWVFDTANPIFNFDRRGPAPWKRQDAWQMWTQLRDYSAHIHIKDATWNPAKNDADYNWPGEGQGRVRDILKDAFARGYDAGISIEPHMVVVFHDDARQKPPPEDAPRGELRRIRPSSGGNVAKRSSRQAMDLRVLERTQRLLGSNVQEALALEVGLLKLNL